MNLQQFAQSEAWAEFENLVKNELIDKPMSIVTEGKSVEAIALEVRASQLAAQKILNIMRKINGVQPPVTAQSFK